MNIELTEKQMQELLNCIEIQLHQEFSETKYNTPELLAVAEQLKKKLNIVDYKIGDYVTFDHYSDLDGSQDIALDGKIVEGPDPYGFVTIDTGNGNFIMEHKSKITGKKGE